MLQSIRIVPVLNTIVAIVQLCCSRILRTAPYYIVVRRDYNNVQTVEIHTTAVVCTCTVLYWQRTKYCYYSCTAVQLYTGDRVERLSISSLYGLYIGNRSEKSERAQLSTHSPRLNFCVWGASRVAFHDSDPINILLSSSVCVHRTKLHYFMTHHYTTL